MLYIHLFNVSQDPSCRPIFCPHIGRHLYLSGDMAKALRDEMRQIDVFSDVPTLAWLVTAQRGLDVGLIASFMPSATLQTMT